jgi:diguanylate cyclase (GGDEF)-like protein/putative nucleotidyltransferase with HDIG domain
MSTLPIRARLFIGLVLAAGVLGVVSAYPESLLTDVPRFLSYLVLGLVSSGLKVALPGVTGTISLNFLMILMGVAELTKSQTLAIGLCVPLVQGFWHARVRPRPIQILFNQAVVSVAVSLAFVAFRSRLAGLFENSMPMMLLLASITYFVFNTFPVAAIVALTENKNLGKTWKDTYFWSLPYYLLGAALVCLIVWMNRNTGWGFSLLVLPLGYAIYRSYRIYLNRLEQINALHLRTIEALALAIEAKERTVGTNFQRVQHFAVSFGRMLGLSEPELEALRAASVLHDIGKLAVPEHIASKPGRLTAQEFEKMKIHPVVGAEILEGVEFPYDVASIVRAHHERWDGSGYPYGLKGEEIPLAARILSVVDSLDALATDRQYRKALPLDQAMEAVRAQSGTSFDPRIVELVDQHYVRLETEAKALTRKKRKNSLEIAATRTGAGAAAADQAPDGAVAKIAAAGQEAQFMLGLVRDLGNSLELQETLSVVAGRLSQVTRFHAIAIYERRGEVLIPAYVEGQDSELFRSLEIPVGEGLSGWVAKHESAILNGNPSVEPGYLNDPAMFSTLRSAVAVPLAGSNGVVGVLTLYQAGAKAFSDDDLRILTGVSSKIGLSIENILKYRELESFATTDHLTGLLNTRSLFDRLEKELARCERDGTTLTVFLCDLDGFKLVNDRFGHAAGNRVLESFGRGLTSINREYDVLARLGGDEFVVAVAGLDELSIKEKELTMTRLSEEVGLAVCGNASMLSLSVGHATYFGGVPDPNQLLADADSRMYERKRDRKRQRSESLETFVER